MAARTSEARGVLVRPSAAVRSLGGFFESLAQSWPLVTRRAAGREAGTDRYGAATRDGLSGEVALKTVDSSPNKERYERFVREIQTLLELGDQEGILPTIEVYLPESW